MGCDTDLCATNVLEHEGYLVHLLFEQRVLDEVAEHKSNMLASSSWYPDKISCEEWEPKLLTEYKEELLGDKKRFEEMQIMHPHKKNEIKSIIDADVAAIGGADHQRQPIERRNLEYQKEASKWTGQTANDT